MYERIFKNLRPIIKLKGVMENIGISQYSQNSDQQDVKSRLV